MIAESPDLERLVRSPVFSAADQLKALDAILADANIGGVAANFIRLVTSKRRLFFIREMIADYRKLNDAHRGVTRADVTSATALTDAHIAEFWSRCAPLPAAVRSISTSSSIRRSSAG